MRSTQRAPKACSRCSRKRIKCDKQIPCKACTIRGLDDSCAREVVEVRRITAMYVMALNMEELDTLV